MATDTRIVSRYYKLTQMNTRTILRNKAAAETAEHLARLVRCSKQQRLLLNAAQRARARATGEKQ